VTASKLKAAILISGRGSNLKVLIDACAQDGFPAEIALVISNVADAGGLAFAADARIPTKVISHKSFPSREAFDAALVAALVEAGAEFICEAGFMRIHSEGFVRKWLGRMINIHPSLLPAFKGTHVHERVLEAGAKVSGCTVHYVVPELDSGPTILQAEVPVLADDTPERLAARVLEAEHRIYPQALRLIAEGRVRLENGRIVTSGPLPHDF
jgi:phosphoribosylglycinamide formyltransferase-1